jgi:hypothetical protein
MTDVREMSLDDVDLECLMMDRIAAARREAAKGPSVVAEGFE